MRGSADETELIEHISLQLERGSERIEPGIWPDSNFHPALRMIFDRSQHSRFQAGIHLWSPFGR